MEISYKTRGTCSRSIHITLSDDGVIEGIEDATRRFFIGVQWHPEYLDEHASLFCSLVDAAR